MLAYARTTRAKGKAAGDLYKSAHFCAAGSVMEAKERDLDDLQLLRCHYLHTFVLVKQVN